jgi:DNA repair protein RadC
MKDMSAMFASTRAFSATEGDRMELPFGNSGSLVPAGDGCPPLDGSGPNTDDTRLASLWRDRDGQEARDAMLEPARAADGAQAEAGVSAPPSARIGMQASYWRYLQQVAGSDDVLRPAEVLELLLHFGGSGQRAGSFAGQLLDRFGSLGGVVTADPTKLTEVLHGDDLSVMLLKAVRAAVKAIVREPLEDRPVIGSASALMDYLSVTMRHEPTEATRLLFLDRKNALIKDEIQHRGTVDHTPLYPREVVKRVLELGASAVILVHNHPSGDPTPSQSDIEMTRQLAAALSTINVVLHDHVIVGRNREISLRKSNLL